MKGTGMLLKQRKEEFMKNIFELLKDNPLFYGIDIGDFEKLVQCMEAKQQHFGKGEVVFLSGTPITSVGIVLCGSVQIIRESGDGKQVIMTELSVSELFGEVFACAGISHSPVTVLAAEDCDILFLNYRKIITTCPSSCVFHTKLIENMLRLMAQKNLMLNGKIEILSKRGIRERLLLFFDTQRGTAQKFSIPYNRDQLAAFLCVERSAMSAELSKMRREGLIRFHKSEFEIL
jgi:CRP-like cAMP-binding protein